MKKMKNPLIKKKSIRKMLALLFPVLIFLVACTKQIDFADEGPFVKLELYSASAGTYLDHFPKIIIISEAGDVHLFTKEMLDRR
ncbi:MAG: hypothetical protein L0I79_04395, partial [Atopostipes sp.]|nr:hypothetical protein [Atopostipes sp.]